MYRAINTTLGRQVAIKILPDTFATDPERPRRDPLDEALSMAKRIAVLAGGRDRMRGIPSTSRANTPAGSLLPDL